MAYPLFTDCYILTFMGSACLPVKNKLCLAVLCLDGAFEGRVGLGDRIGRYQADDASQGLFLILQAMRESKAAGVGLRCLRGGLGGICKYVDGKCRGQYWYRRRFILLKCLSVLSN